MVYVALKDKSVFANSEQARDVEMEKPRRLVIVGDGEFAEIAYEYLSNIVLRPSVGSNPAGCAGGEDLYALFRHDAKLIRSDVNARYFSMKQFYFGKEENGA